MKKYSVIKLLSLIMIAAVMAASMGICAFAAGNSKTFITNLYLLDTGFSEKYTVLVSGLNLYDSSEQIENIYLGYENGKESKAITDIRVLTSYSESGVSINGIHYDPVSSKSLNDGTDGTDIYMYYTKDTAAGEPIMALSVSAYRTDKKTEGYDGAALLGNGYEPIKDENGKPANIESGREGMYLYLHQIHKTVYKPYVCDVHVVSADNRKNAIYELASLGCCYFIDEDMTSGEAYVMVGYNRTTDASYAISSLRGVPSDAVNGNTVKDGAITYTLSDKVSLYDDRNVYLAYATGGDSPVYVLNTATLYADQSFTVASCAGSNFTDSSISPYLRMETEYNEALENNESLKAVNVPLVNDNENTINLSVIYKGNEAFVAPQLAANEKEAKNAGADDVSVQETAEHYTGELLTEEGEAIYLDDIEAETEASDNASTKASAFGTSGVFTVIALALLGFGAAAVVLLKKKISITKVKESGEGK